MHGQIDAHLTHYPPGSNNLVVTGTLVANTPGEITTRVKEIKAELKINGGSTVKCNTNKDNNGNPLYPSFFPGTPWTMNASTTDCGAAISDAQAFDDNGQPLLTWQQPPLPPQIVVY
jgi:hypothetical protein